MPPADELRKVQITGGTTFTVSLPKDWAVACGIRNGSLVRLEGQPDGSLLLRPGPPARSDAPPQRLDASGQDGAGLLRSLISLYLAGVDAIEVRSSPRLSLSQRETVRRFTRTCMGPEIVEETGDRVLLRDLLDPGEFTLPNALQRVHLITTSMVQDAVESVARLDADLAADVVSRDDEVDRLHRLVGRRFARMLGPGGAARESGVTLPEAHHLFLVSRLLERCADHAARVAELVAPLRERAPRPEDVDRLRKLGERSTAILERAFRAFRASDLQAANALIDESHRLLAEKSRLREALVRAGPQQAALCTVVVESLERIHQYASDIAEVTLNRGGTPSPRERPESREANINPTRSLAPPRTKRARTGGG